MRPNPHAVPTLEWEPRAFRVQHGWSASPSDPHVEGLVAYVYGGSHIEVRPNPYKYLGGWKDHDGWVAATGLSTGGSIVPQFVDAHGRMAYGTAAGGPTRFLHSSKAAAKAAAERWYAALYADLSPWSKGTETDAQRRVRTGVDGLSASPRPANATSVAMLARELQVSARDAADLARQAGLTVERGHIVDRTADGSGWDKLHAQCTPCLLNAIRAKRATLSIAFIQFADRLTGER